MIKKIVAVAIQYNNYTYSLPAPNRHHDVIRYIFSITGGGLHGPTKQGFLLNDGTYVDRATAYNIAIDSKQILVNTCPQPYIGRLLFSEDLW